MANETEKIKKSFLYKKVYRKILVFTLMQASVFCLLVGRFIWAGSLCILAGILNAFFRLPFTMPVKKFFRYFLAILMIFSSYKIVTTMRFYKIYDYKSAEHKIEGGEIFARLEGEYKDIAKQKTILSKPYLLLISFRYSRHTVNKVNIKEIKLIDTDTQEIVFGKSDLTISVEFRGYFEYGDHEVYSALGMVIFDDLDLDYSNYKLHIIYSTEGENPVVDNEEELLLEKDYSEYWSNDIWDGLASV